MIKNVVSIIDGGAGSCGKAKVVGEIATDDTIKVGASVTNCMPNAGHTFVSESGKKTVFRNIPVAAVNPETELFIGPGSAIDMEVFEDEYERVHKILNGRKIYVHEMVPLIEERHKEYEREHIKSGSTFKGCGAVTQEKVVRDPRLNFFKGFEDAVVIDNYTWLTMLHKHLNSSKEYVLLEGSQGCDLDLNHSSNYPYVTSRNVSTAQLLADSGISPERLLQTIMVVRPFPIRISNVTRSGDYIYTGDYGSGKELTWTEINIASKYNFYPNEYELEGFDDNLSIDTVKELLSITPEIYLMQIFGNDYLNVDPAKVTLLEALEMERLYYKSKGETSYLTNLLELPMKDIKDIPGLITDLSEQTTVTKMERRVFDLDINKLMYNCLVNTPSSLYLNFFEHLCLDYKGIDGTLQEIYVNRYIREYMNWLESKTGVPISTLGTGEKNNERIIKTRMLKKIKK